MLKSALLIDGPRRANWRQVTVDHWTDIKKHVGGSFEYAYVVDGLSVYVNAYGLRTYPCYARAVQAMPNSLYPDGVMRLHGPVLVLGPGDEDGNNTPFTPALMPLVETVFIPELDEGRAA